MEHGNKRRLTFKEILRSLGLFALAGAIIYLNLLIGGAV